MNRACFPEEKHPNSQKWAKFMNFSFWSFLWFGLPGRTHLFSEVTGPQQFGANKKEVAMPQNSGRGFLLKNKVGTVQEPPTRTTCLKSTGGTPPICTALRPPPFVTLCLRRLPSLEERETPQYASYLYRSTPPLCTAVRLPFVPAILLRKYQGLGVPGKFRTWECQQKADPRNSGKFILGIQNGGEFPWRMRTAKVDMLGTGDEFQNNSGV